MYGYDYEILSKSDRSKEKMYETAREQIEFGLPVIIFPKEYSDIIFEIGFCDGAAVLKGMSFIDGDDRKNAAVNFKRLKQYSKWYDKDFDMMILKPAGSKITLREACSVALIQEIEMLSNTEHSGDYLMRGSGLVML